MTDEDCDVMWECDFKEQLLHADAQEMRTTSHGLFRKEAVAVLSEYRQFSADAFGPVLHRSVME